ncbi:FkbM family methyltransferase [Corynebacterium casei]|uniref:FkbM family methyltransferase n=1 Tax=Corynebacterium casei TaxID=160386 RepID=UPI003FD07C56
MEKMASSQASFEYLDREFSFTGTSGEYIFERLKKQEGFYELELLEALGESLFAYEGDIVDVGANLGNHTVYFGGVLERKVWAFEPESQNFELLTQNIRNNKLEQVTQAFNIAAWHKIDSLSIAQNVKDNAGTFSVTGDSGKIPAAPLDDYLLNHQIALIKIDVEGAEINVLHGLDSTIEKSRPIITVEAHSSHERTEQIAFFEERNYRSIAIEGRSDNFIWCPEENQNFHRIAQRLSVQKRRSIEKNMAQLRSRQGLLLRRTLKIQNQMESLIGAYEQSENSAATSNHSETGHQVLRIQVAELLKLIEAAESELKSKIDEVTDEIRAISEANDDSRVIADTSSELKHESSMERVLDGAPLDNVDGTIRSLFDSQANTLAEVRKSVQELSEPNQYVGDVDHEGATIHNIDQDESVCVVDPGTTDAFLPLGNLEDGLARLLVDVSQNHRTTVEMLRQLHRRLRGMENRALPDTDKADEKVDTRLVNLLKSEVSKLSFLLEKESPELWDASNLTSSVERKIERLRSPEAQEQDETSISCGHELTPLFAGTKHKTLHGDRIRVGVATMPGREAGLRKVLEIISPQADEVFVYLNNFISVPDSCRGFSNVSFFTGPDLGDRGKFAFMEGFSGYYLTVDDDIEYAPFHVQHIIDGIERYGRRAVVGWHGSIFADDFEEFYNAQYRKVLSFRFLRGRDTQVHLLGTGVCGFHTDSIGISSKDFIHPNMADVFLAIEAQRQNVPMMVLAHEKDWARPIDVGPSISTASMKKDEDETGGLDVATIVSDLVKDNMPWQMPEVAPVYTRKPFTVAFIGRTDKERWKKGGILKSAHLTVTALARFGVRTILEDIETGDPCNLSGNKADIIMIYVGDPERPDFKEVEAIVAHHADAGKQVIVNLSINGIQRRSEMVVGKIAEWNSRWPGQMWLMVFTQSAFQIPELAPIKERMLLVPKTISLPNRRVATFGSSEGVFIGDIGKLNNDSLLDYPAEEWITAIREALPGVKIYAVKQYKPAHDRHLDIDETWEFLNQEQFADRIGRRRLMVTPVKYATFEMVPLEVAALGVPIVYPEMPQSLSEHLGGAGTVIRSPEELKRMLPLLYHDPIVWQGMSRAGIEKSESAELSRASSQLYLQLAKLI